MFIQQILQTMYGMWILNLHIYHKKKIDMYHVGKYDKPYMDTHGS